MATGVEVLGRTLPEMGFELLREVVKDDGGLGSWCQSLLKQQATMNARRGRRQRDLLPLPILQRTRRQVIASLASGGPFADLKRARRGGSAATEADLTKLKRNLGCDLWTFLQVVSLNFWGSGCSASAPKPCLFAPNLAQRHALARIEQRSVALCGPDPDTPIPRGPSEPWNVRCSQQRLTYEGDMVASPVPITAAQVESGLPPAGLGASVDVCRHTSGDLRWYLEDPRRPLA